MKKIIIFMTSIFLMDAIANGNVITYQCVFSKYTDKNGFHNESSLEGGLKFVVDTVSGKVVQQGNNGLADVIFVLNEAERSITFIEKTNGENIMMTTITSHGIAVHSRNTVAFDTPKDSGLVASQHYSRCSIM